MSNDDQLGFALQEEEQQFIKRLSMHPQKLAMSTENEEKSRENQEKYLLNEVSHMVKAILYNNRLLRLDSFSFSLSLGPLQKPLLLGSLVLRAVLQKHLKQVGSCNKKIYQTFATKFLSILKR